MKKRILLPAGLMLVFSVIIVACKSTTTSPPTPTLTIAQLGQKIFFDQNLSNPSGQSCATCHAASTGFSDPNHALVSGGIVTGLFGNRNAPSIGYSQYAPPLHYSADDDTYIGGFFYDGRVNTLEEQAKKPFLNHLEMNDTSIAMLIGKLKQAEYFDSFTQLFGSTGTNDSLYQAMAVAIAAFERTSTFSPFTSKYDYYLAGQATLTVQEKRGLLLFQDTLKGKCANCHITDPDPVSGKVLFTDFTYDNIGVPKNPNNPFYKIPLSDNPEGANAIDRGLGGFLNKHENDGQFKVPSLRNAAISAPYFHNGFFNSLEELVHWYNIRDSATMAGIFPPPEIDGNVNHEELGKLHLSAQEEADIIAFIKTLTDGYK